MRRIRRILLHTVLLVSASRVCGTISTQGRSTGLGDATSPEVVDGQRQRRERRVGKRHLSLTRGKKKNGKEIVVISGSEGNSTDTPLLSSTTSTTGKSVNVRAVKKSFATDKSSSSRLRMSKNNNTPMSSKSSSNLMPAKKRRNSQSRSMLSIMRTGKRISTLDLTRELMM